MSSFYQLMMRKKEETMYATIKGSPTQSPYGVFSGFSRSNYLQLQQNLDSDLEMVIDFTTGDSIINGRVVFMNRSVFDLEVYNDVLSSYNWQNASYNSVIPSTDYSANTNYKVKIIRSSSTISFAYSKNGGAYISTATFTTTKAVSNPATFGTSPVETNRYFNGSINLNQSYIKLGSTKYNLQAVVGYTVVGEPTIVDGVVSGFDVSNYLQVPTDFNNNNFEMILKLEDIGTQNLARTIMRLQNADITIGLTGSNQLSITGISDLSFSSGFNTSGILYVKFVQKGLDYSFGYSNDGITYIMLNKTLTQQISYVSPNRILQSGNWSGISVKLYVKDCRIWINNKLWFNGQQA